MNEKIHEFSKSALSKKNKTTSYSSGDLVAVPNQGEVIYDATAFLKEIVYPTDIGLLNKSREISQKQSLMNSIEMAI